MMSRSGSYPWAGLIQAKENNQHLCMMRLSPNRRSSQQLVQRRPRESCIISSKLLQQPMTTLLAFDQRRGVGTPLPLVLLLCAWFPSCREGNNCPPRKQMPSILKAFLYLRKMTPRKERCSFCSGRRPVKTAGAGRVWAPTVRAPGGGRPPGRSGNVPGTRTLSRRENPECGRGGPEMCRGPARSRAARTRSVDAQLRRGGRGCKGKQYTIVFSLVPICAPVYNRETFDAPAGATKEEFFTFLLRCRVQLPVPPCVLSQQCSFLRGIPIFLTQARSEPTTIEPAFYRRKKQTCSCKWYGKIAKNRNLPD